MKRTTLWVVLLAVIGFSVVAFQAPRKDLNSEISQAVTLVSNYRANTAASGSWVNLQGYNSAVALVTTTLHDLDSLHFAVLQDSAAGAAAAAYDSVDVARTDSTAYAIGYTGTKQFIRVLLRASGGAGDSSHVGAVIVRGDCRRKPC